MKKLQKQMHKRQRSVNERERSSGTVTFTDRDGPIKTVEIRDKKETKTIEVPTYDKRGRHVRPREKEKRKRTVITVSVLTGALLFVYSPQFFTGNGTDMTAQEISVETDLEAIRSSNSILRANSMEDFDGDGVSNADETAAGTDPWRIDTDGDGVTDYAELHITGTSPTEWTAVLQDVQIKLDKAEDKSLAHPYMIGDIILWPDTYESKSYGSVVETMDGGYRFCGFTGSVLFPESTGKTAYKVENGIHTILENDLTDNTWVVHDGDKVVLSETRYEELFRVGLFGLVFNVSENAFSTVMDVLLPKKGFIRLERVTSEDILENTDSSVINDVEKPHFKESDDSRLQSNMTTLGSLETVRTAIDEGMCVAVSLFNSNQGEYLGIIYGYTQNGNLLLAGMENQEEMGVMHVTEKARKMLNEEGEIVSIQYFDWDCYGFSSSNNDRISFFGCSDRKGGTNR